MKKFTLIALSFGLITSCSEDGVSGFSEYLSTTTVMETINFIAFEDEIMRTKKRTVTRAIVGILVQRVFLIEIKKSPVIYTIVTQLAS